MSLLVTTTNTPPAVVATNLMAKTRVYSMCEGGPFKSPIRPNRGNFSVWAQVADDGYQSCMGLSIQEVLMPSTTKHEAMQTHSPGHQNATVHL